MTSQFFADVVDYYTDTGRLIATGNVVFVSVDSRIAADRVEFNTADRTGTFYNASGIASLGVSGRPPRMFGHAGARRVLLRARPSRSLGPVEVPHPKGRFTTCVRDAAVGGCWRQRHDHDRRNTHAQAHPSCVCKGVPVL